VKWIEAKMGCWPLFDWGDDRVADHVEVLVCKPSVASSVARAAEVLKDYPTVASQVAKFAEAQKGNSSAFITIGGNTSFEGQSGSQSDGGAVAVRVRFVSDVAKNIRGDLGFVRLER
jgi:hypothetical protein